MLAIPFALVVGVAIGAVGAGGSLVAIPVLVYAGHQSLPAATAASLVIVGLSSFAGAVPHLRRRTAHVDTALLFMATGLLGTAAGTQINERADGDVLLLVFAGLVLSISVVMVRRQRSAITLGGDRPERRLSPRLVAMGLTVGFLTGLFGVGGGFMVIPALVIGLRFSLTEAVGTSLLVIALNAMVALAMRLPDLGIDWAIAAPFTAAALVGVAVGGRVARHADPGRLTLAFAGLLAVVAIYTGTRATMALAA